MAAKTSPAVFFREVRDEVKRVTWPTRKETLVTTAMVLLMAFATAIFFFVVDWFLAHAVRIILDLGA